MARTRKRVLIMKSTKWPPEKAAALADLAAQGLSRREIAAHMSVGVKAVTTKLVAMRIYLPLNPEGYRGPAHQRLMPAHFPRFENVTRCEARRITHDAPPSGKPSRAHDFSLTGNAADLCAS